MTPAEPTPRTLRDLAAFIVALAPIIGMEVAGLVWMGFWEQPIYSAIARRFGLTEALLAGVVFWSVVVGLWTRVPPMPGLLRGALCIVGWFYIGNSVLVWSAFAVGALCGANGF